ncbi:MAG TPA: phosphate ABC transporter permease PstA [Sulfuricaulis sp.]|nr:phosphate ABC transporter permease PstA [Gammaproteobacteria bacterium]HEU5338163.1 phosphate ABC transporter permease PstA [Sulfuricaulis sp.]
MDWRYMRRRTVNIVNLSGAVLATIFGLFWLFWIIWTTLSFGITAIDWNLFLLDTPAPGGTGGLANAIVGSLIMVGLATTIGTPVGILAGTYLAEYGGHSFVAGTIRFINDILLSAPSIIIGLFIYELVVINMGHFSALAGALALAIIMLPVIIRTTEEMLKLVPNPLREAALALGAPRWKMITLVAYRAALSGILTGMLLAVARIAGETAPLLFTALNNQFWSTDLMQPMANLPVVIFQFAMSPYKEWHTLAWAGSLLITLSVLVLSIVARTLSRKAKMEH